MIHGWPPCDVSEYSPEGTRMELGLIIPLTYDYAKFVAKQTPRLCSLFGFGTDIAVNGRKQIKTVFTEHASRRIRMNSEVLTVQEVANYLRVDIRTVYRLAKRGDIPCIKIGRQWRFNRDDIRELVSRGHRNRAKERSDLP
jgi:excisionase family DNA binding protein